MNPLLEIEESKYGIAGGVPGVFERLDKVHLLMGSKYQYSFKYVVYPLLKHQ